MDVVYDKIIHHGEGEGEYKDADYTEDLKATIKSTGDNPPTVNDDGTISIPKNGAVDIDSEIKSEDPEQAGKKAHNSVAVPQNAQNETVSVKPNTDGSADITLENSDDSVKVNGIEYTTTEDDTIINITENGSTLTKGAVELDGGKTPKEGINVNNVSVTNAGLNGSTASVKKSEDGSTSLEVSPNGAFELAVIGQPENGVTIKNTSDSDGEYVVKPDGSVDVSGDSIVNFKTSSGNKTITVLSDSDEESEETGPNKVNVKPTEDGIRLTAPQGSGFDMNGVKYTNSAEDDDDLVITVGSDGVPTLNEGKTTFTDGGKLQLKENGPVITGKGGDIVADDLGNVSVPGDAVLEVQTQDGKKSSYTATEDDTQIHFDLSNPQTSVPEIKSGSVALGKGSSIKAGGNTFTSTGVNSPIVNIPEQSDPENAGISSTVDLVPNSAVTIERTVTGAGGTPSTLKTNVGIPAGSDGLKLVSNSDGIVSMIVDSGETFTLSSPDVQNSNLTITNLGEETTYSLEPDGSIKLGENSSLQIRNSSGLTINVSSDKNVSMMVTELGTEFAVEPGQKITINGVEYEAGTSATKLVVDAKGNTVVTEGSVKVPQGKPVYILDEDGELVKVEKTASSEPSDSPEGITVAADCSVIANDRESLPIGFGTYT